MIEGKGKFYVRRIRRGPRGGTLVATIYVSCALAKDSRWPFKHKDSLTVIIENGRVILSKEAKK